MFHCFLVLSDVYFLVKIIFKKKSKTILVYIWVNQDELKGKPWFNEVLKYNVLCTSDLVDYSDSVHAFTGKQVVKYPDEL